MQLIFDELRPSQLRRNLTEFEIRTTQFNVGRGLFALAQLSALVLTPYAAIMQTLVGQSASPQCDGIKRASIYCLAQSLPAWAPTGFMVAILVSVVLGLVPPAMAVLHAWVSFSLLVSVSLPDGGDQAAAVFSLLIIAVSFGDDRLWIGGSRDNQVKSWRRQVSLAGTMLLRVQVAALYFDSSLGKLFTTDWVNGTAEFYILRDPYFGASGPVGAVLDAMSSSNLVTVAMTWGAMGLEASIATLILCGPRCRRAAMWLCIGLHGFIILSIGLWSFGMVMIGAVTIAALPVRGALSTGNASPPASPQNRFVTT